MEDVSSGPLWLQVIQNTILTVLNQSEKFFVYIMEKADQALRLSHCYCVLAGLSSYELYFFCVNSFSERTLLHPPVVRWLLQPESPFILGGNGDGKSMCLSMSNCSKFSLFLSVLIFCVDFYLQKSITVAWRLQYADDCLRLGLHPPFWNQGTRDPQKMWRGFPKGWRRRHGW